MALTSMIVIRAASYFSDRNVIKRKPKSLVEILQPEENRPKPRAGGLPLRSRPLRSVIAAKSDQRKSATRHHFALALGMLGVTTVGLAYPLLGLASLPALVYLNLPFLAAGRQEVVEEKRAGIGVLNSAASLGMLALGNFFADALFLSAYFLSRKLINQTRADMQAVESSTDALPQKHSGKSQGERLAEYGTLPVLGLGAVTLVLLGAHQAVAVLVNHFGFDLRVVAPLCVLTYQRVAAGKGIQITDGRALEALQGSDLLFVLDETLATHPETQNVMATLTGRGLSVIQSGQNSQAGALDDPSRDLPAGRRICFVGATLDTPAAPQPGVIVSWTSTPASEEALRIQLAQNDLSPLIDLLDLVEALKRSIQTSFVITVVPSVICLAGIYFLNFGVVTGLVLDYLGFGLGALYALAPQVTAQIEDGRRWANANRQRWLNGNAHSAAIPVQAGSFLKGS